MEDSACYGFVHWHFIGGCLFSSAMAFVWKSKDNFVKLVLHCVGLGTGDICQYWGTCVLCERSWGSIPSTIKINEVMQYGLEVI